MDRQPTYEELKEFWEWCGFTCHKVHQGDSYWEKPNGLAHGSNPPRATLDNLFKYAVPLAVEKLQQRYALTKPAYEWIFAKLTGAAVKGEDLGRALFWILREVLHG